MQKLPGLIIVATFAIIAMTLAIAWRAITTKPTYEEKLVARFEDDFWPLLERGKANGCVGCHRDAKEAPLPHFTGNIELDFKNLRAAGYFSETNTNSFLARLTSENPKLRMPPTNALPPWSTNEIDAFRQFALTITNR